VNASITRSFLIALTGGIASGKTVVANEFADLGVPVFDTDQIARDVVEPGTASLAQIVTAFGASVLDGTGRLDRRRMRDLVFSNPALRKKLEAITHPAIREELARRSVATTGIYKIHVIPLLIEGGSAGIYDRVLVVDCPEETQMARLMQRDRTDELAARRILAAQATRAQRLAQADDVIENTADIAALRDQVRALHANYLKMATAQ
jgi:dephospho-CoA kinase